MQIFRGILSLKQALSVILMNEKINLSFSWSLVNLILRYHFLNILSDYKTMPQNEVNHRSIKRYIEFFIKMASVLSSVDDYYNMILFIYKRKPFYLPK